MSYPLALITALIANTAGDVVGFMLADKYGEWTVKRLHIKRSYVDGVEKYVTRHPRATIFISRFGGTLDPVVNILSGLGDVSFSTFLIFDFLGNLVSLTIVITIGYYLGDYWQSFSGVVSTVGWIIFAVLLVIGICIIFRKQIGLSESRLGLGMRRMLRRLNGKFDI